MILSTLASRTIDAPAVSNCVNPKAKSKLSGPSTSRGTEKIRKKIPNRKPGCQDAARPNGGTDLICETDRNGAHPRSDDGRHMGARRLTPLPVQVDVTWPTDNGARDRRRGVVRRDGGDESTG